MANRYLADNFARMRAVQSAKVVEDDEPQDIVSRQTIETAIASGAAFETIDLRHCTGDDGLL